MATRIRAEVNTAIFTRITDRMGEQGQARIQALVTVAEDGYSMFHRFKKPAQRASWSRFKAQAAHLAQVDEISDTDFADQISEGRLSSAALETASTRSSARWAGRCAPSRCCAS